MLVNEEYLNSMSETIIYRFEDLLCNNDVKLNNLDPSEDKFENETSYINEKDKKELKDFIVMQLEHLIEDYEVNAA